MHDTFVYQVYIEFVCLGIFAFRDLGFRNHGSTGAAPQILRTKYSLSGDVIRSMQEGRLHKYISRYTTSSFEHVNIFQVFNDTHQFIS